MAGTLLAGQKMTAALIGVPPWTAMSLLNGWTNFAGNVTGQYRKWALLNSVEIIGCLDSASASNVIFAQLPAGYIPASQQEFAAGCSGASANTNSAYVSCDTSGNLSSVNTGTSATLLVFHGWISLDA